MLVTIQNCSFLLANGAPVPALMRFILHRPPPSGLRGFVPVVRDRCEEQGWFGVPGARGHGGWGPGRGGDTMGGGGVWEPGTREQKLHKALGPFWAAA